MENILFKKSRSQATKMELINFVEHRRVIENFIYDYRFPRFEEFFTILYRFVMHPTHMHIHACNSVGQWSTQNFPFTPHRFVSWRASFDVRRFVYTSFPFTTVIPTYTCRDRVWYMHTYVTVHTRGINMAGTRNSKNGASWR